MKRKVALLELPIASLVDREAATFPAAVVTAEGACSSFGLARYVSGRFGSTDPSTWSLTSCPGVATTEEEFLAPVP